MARDLRDALFTRIQTFSFANLDAQKTGQLMVRLTSDVNAVQRVVLISLRIGTRAPRTESRIHKALLGLMSGRTSFVIAHRLSTIRDADQVLVIDNGRIVEKGTHRELIERRGFYHHLYLSQFKGRSI